MRNYNVVRTYFETILCCHPTDNCEIAPTLAQIEITTAYEDENYICLDRISTSNEGGCGHCGQVISKIKDYKTSYIRLLRTYGVLTDLLHIIASPGLIVIANPFHVVRQFIWGFLGQASI